MPLVIFLAVPPAIGTVYRSPTRSKMMVWPSGETSSESHVPSLVANSILRAGLSGSGSSFFGAASFGDAEGACFGGSAVDDEIRAERAISAHTNRRRIERRMKFSGRGSAAYGIAEGEARSRI